MNKLVSRSLEIMGKTVKSIGDDYTSNLTGFFNDAKNVKNAMVRSTTDASDVFAKLKNTNITKKISDWFYEEESKGDSATSDEFDAGFKIDSSDEPKLDGASSSRALDADSMSDIADKQANTMLKIGRRQTEQTVANTAEIISTINSRSSEMVASMNNINKSLIGISDRLDKIIQLTTVNIEEQKREIDKGTLFNDGKLSLMSIFDASKRSLGENQLVSMGQIALQSFQNGMTPDALLKMALDMTVLNKKSNALGGKSINDVGKSFNDMIGTVTQTAMNELIGSKPFKKLFGDITSIDANTDYGRIVPNHYDTKRAQFDGMTRMSIIQIIPEYLNKINESLSGKSFHIDSKGKLVEGPRSQDFSKVTDNAFASTGLTSNAYNNIQTNARKVVGNKLSAEDINLASKALTGVIVMDMHRRGVRLFKQSDLKNMDMTEIISMAAMILCDRKNDPEYWGKVCQVIVLQLSSGLMDGSKFVQNVNQSLQNMITAATDFAQSGKANASQATTLSMGMMRERFNAVNQTTQSTDTTTTSARANEISAVRKPSKLGEYTTNDYVRGIFGILNRGINVKINKGSHYGNYDIERRAVEQIKEDEKAAQLFGSIMGGGDESFTSAIKGAITSTTEAILGKEGATAASQAAGAGGGFMSSMMGILGAQGMGNMMRRAFNGTLKNDVKGLVGDGGPLSKLMGTAKSKVNNVRHRVNNTVAHDARLSRMRDDLIGEDGIINGVRTRVGDALSYNHTFANVKNKTRQLINNGMYIGDNHIRNFASGVVDNYETSDEFTKLVITSIKSKMEKGDYEGAENSLKYIRDPKLKKNLKRLIDIDGKRAANEGALVADMGTTFESSSVGRPNDTTGGRGGIIGIVQKGFSMVGKVLKSIAKLAATGITNITFGLKTMGAGLFGGKRRDADGNVMRDENGKVIRDHGIIQNLTTDLWGSIGNAVGDMQITGSSPMTVREGVQALRTRAGQGIRNAKDKLMNMTFTGQYERDFKGRIMRDENGNALLTNTATIGDLLKKPGEVLAKSLKNIATDISNSGLGKTIKGLAKSIADSKLGQGIRKLGNTIRSGAGEGRQSLADKFKNTKFGSGFMSGFGEAAKAKAAMNDHKERMSSFANKAVGNIMDVVTGKYQGPSALTQLADILTGIRNDINGNHEETMEAQEENAASASETQTATVDSGSTAGSITQSQTTSDESSSTPTQAPDISAASSAATGGSSGGADAGGDAAATAGGSGGGKKGGLLGNMLGNLGKIFGGFTQALLGIGQLVLSVVMSLEGFQALQEMVQSILTDGLQPLNEIFEATMELIKPIVNILKEAVSSIAETVVSIASALIGVIQPLMEALNPLIETLFDVLEPILDIIQVLVEIIMVPIMIIMQALQPVIEAMGYQLQVMTGVLQLGLGGIMTLLGGLLTGVGWLINKLGFGDDIQKQGEQMLGQGKDMMKTGGEQIVTGVKGMADLAKRLIPGGEPLIKDTSTQEQAPSNMKNDANINAGAMGSGDPRIITTNSYVYNNTYGSGNTYTNQHSYGNYMNMSERGCGPVALADAYARRTGSRINPSALASTMAGGGAYDPNRGTSVGSFIRTGNAMGMNMRVGGVTQASLKRATPNNPITLLGSGGDYGTRTGNDHYVNVIGTDRNGFAYVSNPLTGRVERRSATTLAMNSRLGLYGSGDADIYSFDENTTAALDKLKELTSKFTGMFTGESKSDKVTKEIEAGKEAEKATSIKRGLDDDKYAEIEAQAFEQFKKDNPKLDSESEEEYAARIEKLWSKSANYNKYIAKYGGQAAYEVMKQSGDDTIAGSTTITSGLDSFIDGMKNISTINGGDGQFMSETGARMFDFGIPMHDVTNITSSTSGESPVHDFFGIMNKSSAYSANGNWFQFRHNPNNKGIGSSGDSHGGIDILWKDGSEGKALHAITEGDVVRADYSNSAGYNVMWRDTGGWHHWYMHMLGQPEVRAGDKISAGQLLGYVGNTGQSSGAHLHYTIKKNRGGSTGDSDVVNPLTYFSRYIPSGNLVGNDDKERVWNYLISQGLTKEGAASIMGNFEAESAVRANNLQNTYEKSLGMSDEEYTSAVDNGTYTNFIHDSAGYGLGQWTHHERKQRFMDYMKAHNAPSIGDLNSQLNFFVDDEMNKHYSSMFNEFKSSNDIDAMTKRFMFEFENPADKSATAVNGRISKAKSFYNMYKDLNPVTQQSMTGGTYTETPRINSADDWKKHTNLQNIGTMTGMNSGYVITNDSSLNMRSGPNTSSDIIGKIPKDHWLGTLEYDGNPGWYKTNYNGKTGYVSAEFIKLDNWYDSSNDQSMLEYFDPNTRNSSTTVDISQNVQAAKAELQASREASARRADDVKYASVDQMVNYKKQLLYGSGDSSNFWYDSLFNNEPYMSSEIPPLDPSKFNDGYGVIPQTNIIRRYEIKSEDMGRKQFLDKMGKMTFNVRAQRVEELLETLIEKIDGNKPSKSTQSSGSTNLFTDNSIPEQVSRLARG